MHPTLIIGAFAALVLAAPAPQDIAFDQVDAAPDPEIYTVPSDGSSQTVSVLPLAAVTTIADATVTDVAKQKGKRDFLGVAYPLGKRDGDCTPEPAGTGPQVST